MLSIITVNLNNKFGLLKTKGTVELLTTSTFDTDLEWIIVDGGSTDGSLDLDFGNFVNFDLIVGLDSGIYNAMNLGIARAKGDFLLFLNSGDCLIGELTLLKSINSGLLFPSITEGTWLLRRDSIPLWIGMPASHQSMVFPANKAIKYDESFFVSADYKYFIDHLIFGSTFNRVSSISSVVENYGVSRTLRTKAFQESRKIRQIYFHSYYLVLADLLILAASFLRFVNSFSWSSYLLNYKKRY